MVGPIDRGSAVGLGYETRAEVGERFGRSDQQISSLRERLAQPVEHVASGFGREVDGHVSAEDDVERPDADEGFEQIATFEGDQ